MDDEALDALFLEYVARSAGGKFLRVEGDDILVYRCGNCGNEHRIRAELVITPVLRSATVPEAFYKAFEGDK